jgi:hypothetical protein
MGNVILTASVINDFFNNYSVDVYIEEMGEDHVIVSRRHTGDRVSMAVYLVDIRCVGLKDSFYRLRLEDYEFKEMIVTHSRLEASHWLPLLEENPSQSNFDYILNADDADWYEEDDDDEDRDK